MLSMYEAPGSIPGVSTLAALFDIEFVLQSCLDSYHEGKNKGDYFNRTIYDFS